MAWHLEAVGSGGVRGTGDEKTMDLAADLYEMVVTNFDAKQFVGVQVPAHRQGGLAEHRQDPLRDGGSALLPARTGRSCGPAFDAVVAENPNGPNAAEAAFASVLCYQNIYAKKHKDGSAPQGHRRLAVGQRKEDSKKGEAEKFKKKPFTDEQKGMITAFNRYVCYIKPPAGDNDALEQYVEVKYARARTYFEAQHWEEAAWAFRDIAINYPQMDAAIYAAQLYLESLNILGSKVDPPHEGCYDPMGEDVPVFIKNFCEGEKKREENEDQCNVLFRIQRDIERLKAENLVKACDEGKSTNCIKKYEEAGNLYYCACGRNTARRRARRPAKDKKDKAAACRL